MSSFSLLIRKWYRQNKRNLPWRSTQNPYFIWLSEIILQQTRVDQGLPYYKKFTSHFPTIHDLANADENKVLNLWQGLGYYSRARNLHAAAKQILTYHNGVFPNNYKDIRNLKGIGDYTAAAICSFSYELPHAVVDGNVYRVLSRYFNDPTPIDSSEGKKLFSQLATDLLDENRPGEHNQAIMELGALICTPKSPNCQNCPIQDNCLALRNNTFSNLPLKSKKIKIKNRYFNYLVDVTNPILYKREGKDIWENLYEFPLVETTMPILTPSKNDFISKNWSFELSEKKTPLYVKKHILTHQHIHAHFWSVKNLKQQNEDVKIQALAKNEDYPLPRIISLFLEDFYE
jgi:A/G-specific adenine glycosylase